MVTKEERELFGELVAEVKRIADNLEGLKESLDKLEEFDEKAMFLMNNQTGGKQ